MNRQGGGEGARAGGADPAPGFLRVGAALRQERERRGLTLEEVARATRFTARQVLAVEEGRVADLPPNPYARGLVTAYASLLGLDAEAAAREWGRSADGGAAAARSVFRVPVRARSSWRDWAVPIVCAGVALAYLALAPASGPAPETLADPPSAPAQPAAEPPPQDAEVAPASEPAAPLDAPGVAVELRSEGATWVDVAADGDEQRRQELRPGQNLSLQARRRLALALGDAGAVRVSVNGRDLGFIGDRGEVRSGIVFEAAPAKATAKGRAAADQGPGPER